jgi:hypothetical protein
VEGFSLKFVSWSQQTFTTKKWSRLRLLFDYIHVTQFDIYMFNFLLSLKISQTSVQYNAIYFKSMAQCVCLACGRVWSMFGGMSVQQVVLWFVGVCVCVCVFRYRVVVNIGN